MVTAANQIRLARSAHGPLRIGLTGGIGSGKSTVARMLAVHGATIIDTDAIARELTTVGGAALPALRSAFGDAIITPGSAFDRDQMRRMAFADTAIRRRLEGILHPMISAAAEAKAAANSPAAVIVFDVPLLVESGTWFHRVHRIAVVDCSVETQIARAAQRAGWSADAIKAVIAAQATREQRRSVADDLVSNDGISTQELAGLVWALWQRWTALATAKSL